MKKISLITMLLSQVCSSMERPELFDSKRTFEKETDTFTSDGCLSTLANREEKVTEEKHLNAPTKDRTIEEMSIKMMNNLIRNLDSRKLKTQIQYNKLNGFYFEIEKFCAKYLSEDQTDIEKMKSNFDLAKAMLYGCIFKIYAICTENSFGQSLKDDFEFFHGHVIGKDRNSYAIDAISVVINRIVSNQFFVTNYFMDIISGFDEDIKFLKQKIENNKQISSFNDPVFPSMLEPQPQVSIHKTSEKLPEGAYRDRFTGEIKYYPKLSGLSGIDRRIPKSSGAGYYVSCEYGPYVPFATETSANQIKMDKESWAEREQKTALLEIKIKGLTTRREKTENQYYQLPDFYFEIEKVLNYLKNTKHELGDIIAIFNLSKNIIYENLLIIHDLCEANAIDEILTKELYFFQQQIIENSTALLDFNVISAVLERILSNKSELMSVFTNKISEIESQIISLNYEMIGSSRKTTLDIMGNTPYPGEEVKERNDTFKESPKDKNDFKATKILREPNELPKMPSLLENKDLTLAQSPTAEDLIFLLLESVPEGMHVGKYAQTLTSDSLVYGPFYKSFSEQLAFFNDFNIKMWMDLPQYQAVQFLELDSSFLLPGFSQAMKDNKTIKTLDITDALLTQEDKKCIADILEANKEIQVVGEPKNCSDISFERPIKSIRKSVEKEEIKEKEEINTDFSLYDLELSYKMGGIDEATYSLLKNEFY